MPGSTFQIRLKALRENVGYSSQAAFAKEFGVAQSTVAGWESGAREPNFDTLKKLAQFFLVSTDYLLGSPDEFGHISEAMQPIRIYLTTTQQGHIARKYEDALEKMKINAAFAVAQTRVSSDFYTRLSSQKLHTIPLRDLVVFSDYLNVTKDVYAILRDPLFLDDDNKTIPPSTVMDIANQIYQKEHLSHIERNVISAYRQASPADRQIIDNIVDRYSPQNANTTDKVM